MKAVVSYAGPFDWWYGVDFIDVPPEHIVYYSLSSEYMPIRMRTTYKRYIKLDRIRINDSSLLFLLETLSTKGGTGKNFGLSHIDCSVLYSSEPDEVELMVDAADCFIKNPTKSTTFHNPSFYSFAKSTLTSCTGCTRRSTLPSIPLCRTSFE